MQNFSEEMKTLMTAGFFGSLVRVLLQPEKKWQRWLVQMIVGVASAVFLGQVFGVMIAKLTGAPGASIAAAGFIIGTAAEQVIAWLQKRLLKQ